MCYTISTVGNYRPYQDDLSDNSCNNNIRNNNNI